MNPVLKFQPGFFKNPKLWMLIFLFFVAGCSSPEEDNQADEAQPTAAVIAQATATLAALPTIPPTDTLIPHTDTPEPTATNTVQPTETNTPRPTPTNTLEPSPTNTPTPSPTATLTPPTEASPAQPTSPPPPAQPTTSSDPVLGPNLIPNGSFEEGHYNQDGVAELQVPVKWRVAWDEGPTGIGEAAWDVYVRPEVVVISTANLPPEEHSLYIFNGQHTVKIFKGQGAVSVRLMTDVTLEPGTYIVESKMFADIVERWENGVKVWAQDPYAAEFRFLVGDGGTFWQPQRFGQINVNNYTFEVNETKTITIALAMRGRYAIANNGWFIDDLSLRRIE